jgi:uncharacterized protein YcfL
MNLQLTPEQFVVLYELVSSASFSSNASSKRESLVQIREKLSETIQDSLEKLYQNQNKEKLSTWVKNEEKKISQLTQDLSKLKNQKFDFSYPSDDGLHFPPGK